jgi:hypothetical protein
MMKRLQPHKTDYLGDWNVQGTQVEADETCKRIKWLVAEKLIEITTDASGWDVLYRDPADGRHWELTYPQSHMHGGGPPRLTHLSIEQAKTKYGDSVGSFL